MNLRIVYDGKAHGPLITNVETGEKLHPWVRFQITYDWTDWKAKPIAQIEIVQPQLDITTDGRLFTRIGDKRYELVEYPTPVAKPPETPQHAP